MLLAGIAYLCRAYGIGATDRRSRDTRASCRSWSAAVVGRGVFYYVTIGTVLAVLALSANTGFAGFPRLCRVIAQDGFLPHAFAHRGRRLVYSHGIIVLATAVGGAAGRLRGDHRPPDPAVRRGAFLAFTLSQAGMVVHWWRGKGAEGTPAEGKPAWPSPRQRPRRPVTASPWR